MHDEDKLCIKKIFDTFYLNFSETFKIHIKHLKILMFGLFRCDH